MKVNIHTLHVLSLYLYLLSLVLFQVLSYYAHLRHARLTGVEIVDPPISNSTTAMKTTKSLFFRHRCMCFGQDFKVFNDRKEKQYMFKGALKILGQIELSMSEVETGEEICTWCSRA